MKILTKTLLLLFWLAICLISCEKTSDSPANISPDSSQNQQNDKTDKNVKADDDSPDSVENNKKNTNIDKSKNSPPEKFEDLFPK